MFKLASYALVALTAVSVVNGAAIFPRNTPPAGWVTEIMEPYKNYNTRYLAIGCQNQHNTQFFDDCCHPMKKGETLEKNRKAYCRPGANPVSSSSTPPVMTLAVKPSSSSASPPKPTYVPGDCEGDDCEDDDGDDEDCEDDPVSSPAHVPSYTHTPVLTPSESPKPTPTPTPTPSPTPSPSPSPVKPSPVTSSSKDTNPSPTPASSETHTGGHATWFTQNGNAGACGNTHSDNDFIAALDYRTYGDTSAKSKYCGEKIRVTWQGKSVDVIVADACPTCENSASVDLSVAAFEALAPLKVGELDDITWTLL